MKKKLNPELLKEELKKFKMLSEYDFYQEKKEEPEYKELLLGDIEEADDTPNDSEPAQEPANNAEPENMDSEIDGIEGDLGVDGGEEMSGDIPEPEPQAEPMPEPASDEVEVDVTSLVKGSEEAKDSADKASRNSQMLLQKLSDLEARVSSMAAISSKIEDLEQELIKRNPTPVEKLEMRTLNSAPFNQKLTDYWSDKEGAYDVMGVNDKPKEYVLTKDEIDSNYSNSSIMKTFNQPNYEEEDIQDYNEENM